MTSQVAGTAPVVPTEAVRAAGAVPWRRGRHGVEVALVHRPGYDDWSWPKGKLDPAESWPAAAVREVLEETGLHVLLGIPLPHSRYRVGAGDGTRPKVVAYWAATVLAGDGDLAHEVDDVAWLSIDDARARLVYRRDREQLRALAAAEREGALESRPLAVVRHATSVRRRQWKHDDLERPLDEPGTLQARDMVSLLAAYGFTRVLSSDAKRCAATVTPYAQVTGSRMLLRDSLNEEAFADDPSRAVRTLTKTIQRGEPALLCTHRTVVPALLGALADRAASPLVETALRESSGPGLVKGEVLVAHLAGVADDARVVAVERHHTRHDRPRLDVPDSS